MEWQKEIDAAIAVLDRLAAEDYRKKGYDTLFLSAWSARDRGRKFISLDQGSGGHFLIEKATGEIFNIKAYGVPDYNKKKKSDVGNIKTVSVQRLWDMRYNYLR